MSDWNLEYNKSPISSVLSAFLATILSELGDRTFFVLVFLSMTRSPSAVFVGNQLIMTIMIIFAATIGYGAQLLIDKIFITMASSVLFFIFAGIYFWEAFIKSEIESENQEIRENLLSNPSWFGTFWKTIALVFFAEWGDRSQLSTITLSAVTNPFFTIVGAFFGILVCALCAICIGKLTSNFLPERCMKILAGAVFFGFGVIALMLLIYQI